MMEKPNMEISPEARFLRACRRQEVDCTPVWFMRQAGRYLPEYRRIREKHTLLEICNQAELAAEVTLQPVRRLGVDAAILFADILLPLIPMGIDLEFAAGEGPVIHNPLQTPEDVAALKEIEPRESLAPCFAPERAQLVGTHVRHDWCLASAEAVTSECRPPPR